LKRMELPLPYGEFPATRCALVECQPLTGRRHQLRRHMKHANHPIIGDTTHGKGPLNRALAEWLGVQRMWLHAHSLALTHPITGASVQMEAPTDVAWARWPKPVSEAT
jgi:tRNA pseudouridine65 synthase